MSISSELLKRKFRAVWPHLDERTRRIMAATEAVSLGYGGVSVVARACGLSRKAIRKGVLELEEGEPLGGRVRRRGAGRKSITESHPRRVETLEGLIDEQTRGVQEHAGDCAGTGAAETSRQPREGGADSSWPGLQPAEQPQDRRGRGSPGPRCAVSPYQYHGETMPEAGHPGHFGRHQEEGTHRQLP